MPNQKLLNDLEILTTTHCNPCEEWECTSEYRIGGIPEKGPCEVYIAIQYIRKHLTANADSLLKRDYAPVIAAYKRELKTKEI